MQQAGQYTLRIGHPAPQRGRASRWLLLFALFGAPLAWIVQLLLNFAVTSYVCYSGQAHLVLKAPPGWVMGLIIAVNLVALLVAAVAVVAGFSLVRQTGEEHRQRSGGVMDAGEGRTRFLAVWGLFGGLIFFVALLANTFSLSLVPLCRI